MTHHTKCPVCGSSDLKYYLRCKDWLVSNKEFDLFRCSVCSFILTQDHPEENEIGSYYQSEDYVSHSDTKKGIFNTLYHIVRRLMLSKKKRLVVKSNGQSTGSILDIGSGTGYFISAMKNTGWNATGIEVNEAAREYSIKKFGVSVLHPVEIKNISTESYNCITLWHVLEHLEDLNGYLREIKRLLKPGGTCIIALPNLASYDAEHYGQNWAGYDVPRHLWHFNSDSFNKLAESHNFTCIANSVLPFDSFYISILSEKNKGAVLPLLSGSFIGLQSFLVSAFKPSRNSSLIYILRRSS